MPWASEPTAWSARRQAWGGKADGADLSARAANGRDGRSEPARRAPLNRSQPSTSSTEVAAAAAAAGRQRQPLQKGRPLAVTTTFGRSPTDWLPPSMHPSRLRNTQATSPATVSVDSTAPQADDPDFEQPPSTSPASDDPDAYDINLHLTPRQRKLVGVAAPGKASKVRPLPPSSGRPRLIARHRSVDETPAEASTSAGEAAMSEKARPVTSHSQLRLRGRHRSVDQMDDQATTEFVRPATAMDATVTLLKYETPKHNMVTALPLNAASKQQPTTDAEILRTILPSHTFEEDGLAWTQAVSSEPATPLDAVHLREELGARLLSQSRAAPRETARSCCHRPLREKLHAQCFDEIVRQVALECIERGVLLLRVRDELRMTALQLRGRYESAVASGLQQKQTDQQGKYMKLQRGIRALQRTERQLHEECAATTKREQLQMAELKAKHMKEETRLEQVNAEVRQEMEISIVTQQDGPAISLEQCVENAHEAAYVQKYRRTRGRR
jgi:dynein light intermediate chain